MAFLYVNAKGFPWRKHSYSAGNTWANPFKYKLQKIYGWKEKNTKARFELGKTFEQAVQWFHENRGDRDGAIEKFKTGWAVFRQEPLGFTKVERDWETCQRIGIDWLKLYAIRQPHLPIPLGGQSVFQREYEKEMFPGDPNYGEILYLAKPDIIAFVDPAHPLLARVDWKPEYGPFRPVIIDIKTAGNDFPEQYGLAAHDLQIRSYSFTTGIRDGALLWFVKKGLTIQKGYSVTLLEDAGFMNAGDEAVIAAVDDDGIWLLPNDFMVEEMEKAQGKKTDKNGVVKTDQTNEAKARRDAWLEEHGTFTDESQVTKQRLQFNAGFVTVESAMDAGEIAGKQIIEIVNAWKTQRYPNTFGVRYPHDDRTDPYFTGFVLNNKQFRDGNFTKTDEDVDLFAEEDNEAEDVR